MQKIRGKNVIAIEPNVEWVEGLSKNVPGCSIINSAVSDEDGEVGLYVITNRNGVAYNSLYTDETINKIAILFAWDMSNFKYEF